MIFRKRCQHLNHLKFVNWLLFLILLLHSSLYSLAYICKCYCCLGCLALIKVAGHILLSDTTELCIWYFLHIIPHVARNLSNLSILVSRFISCHIAFLKKVAMFPQNLNHSNIRIFCLLEFSCYLTSLNKVDMLFTELKS